MCFSRIGSLLLLSLFPSPGLSQTSVEIDNTTPVKNITIIAGLPSHPSGEHEFHAGALLLAKALSEQSGLPVKAQVMANGWPKNNEFLDDCDALVIYADGGSSHPLVNHWETVETFLAKGRGLMLMHYALDVPASPEGERLTRWIGGYYEGGFSVNPHWTAKLEPVLEHPVGRGVATTRVHDEWYFTIRFPQPETATALVKGTPTRAGISRFIHWNESGAKNLDQPQPLMWGLQRPDGGRGVGFTGGHWHRNWSIDSYRKLVLNAMVWVTGLDVPADGVVSQPVTQEMLQENLDQKKEMKPVPLAGGGELEQIPAPDPVFRFPGAKKTATQSQ